MVRVCGIATRRVARTVVMLRMRLDSVFIRKSLVAVPLFGEFIREAALFTQQIQLAREVSKTLSWP